MTYITKTNWRKAMFSSRITAILLAGFVLVLLQSSTVKAQWTTGTNINNTNSGTVSVGTTSPGGDKLIVAGNTVGGNITSHTQLYSTYDSQANVVMELGYGTATANITPYPTIVLSKNLTSASNFLGAFQFANRSIADGSDKRIAQMVGWTDGATNSGALSFSTSSAGTLNERMRITSVGKVGIGTTSPGTLFGGVVGSGRILHVANTTDHAQLFLSAGGAGKLAAVNMEVGDATATKRVFQTRYDGSNNIVKSFFFNEANGGISSPPPQPAKPPK